MHVVLKPILHRGYVDHKIYDWTNAISCVGDAVPQNHGLAFIPYFEMHVLWAAEIQFGHEFSGAVRIGYDSSLLNCVV